MSKIDYSKWNNLECDSSSEDEQDSNMPRVTKLDAPSSVTFGGKQAEEVKVETVDGEDDKPAAEKPAAKPKTKPSKKPNPWTDRGSELEYEGRKLYWSQDRYSVTIHLQLYKDDKVASVKIDGILPYAYRNAAVGRTKSKLTCTLKDDSTLMQGELPHHVHYAQNEEDVDWSVVTGSHVKGRYLQITFYKAVPMVGMFVWWRRPLMCYPEQEVDGRYDGGGGKKKSAEELQKAWDEAHKMFKESKAEGTFGPMPPEMSGVPEM